MAAAEIAKQALNLDLHIEDIFRFLLSSQDQPNIERSTFESAYDVLMEAVSTYGNKFFDKTKNENAIHIGELWGDIRDLNYPISLEDGRVCYKEITIARQKFNDIMSIGGHKNPGIVLDEFKKKRILDYETGKLYRKRKIGNAQTVSLTYVIRIIHVNTDVLITPEEEELTLQYRAEQIFGVDNNDDSSEKQN